MKQLEELTISERILLAENSKTSAETLKILSKDTAPNVRFWVAYNAHTPIETLIKLANDKIAHPANDNELRELYSAIQGLKSLLTKSKSGVSEFPNN